MTRKPFLLHEKTRHGKMVWYFRRHGKRIRLPDTYGSDEFNEAYERALSGTTPPPTQNTTKVGSVRWLCDQYKQSAAFMRLAPSTQRARENIIEALLKDPRNANPPFTALSRKDVQAGIDKRAATPNAANNFLKTISGLFKWATDAGHLEVNPALGIKKLSAKSDGFHTWTVEEVQQYRNHHQLGSTARLAIDLLLFLGLRRSDVFVVGRQHLKDGVISMKTQKTGQWVYLPVFKELQQSIDATRTGDLAFLVTAKGKPFASAASFGNWFAKRCKEAGLPDHCRAHGLRKAGATIAANEGASAHELMAMYGWQRLAMAEVYTREADKKRLARAAAERLVNKT